MLNYHQRLSPAGLPTAGNGGHAQCTPSVSDVTRTLQSPLNQWRDSNNTNIAARSYLHVLHSPTPAVSQVGWRWQTLKRLFWGFVSGLNRHFVLLPCDVASSRVYRRFERAYFFHSQGPSFFVHLTFDNKDNTFVRNVGKSPNVATSHAKDGIGDILRSFTKLWTL